MISIKKALIFLGIFGALQFLLMSSVAAYYYDGGAMHFPENRSFSFLYNYFSDLGRTRNFRRETNLFTPTVFKYTILITGVCTSSFFLAFWSVFKKNRLAQGLSVLASLFGVASGLGFLGIAFTPWNEMYWSHFYYVRMSFSAFLTMSILAMFAIYIQPKYPNFYGHIFLIFIFILGTYLLILFYGEHPRRSPNALMWRAFSQKIVVYSQIICMLIQGIGAWRQLSRNKNV